MSKSKRDNKIPLAKKGKKGLLLKQKIVEDLRSCVEKYQGLYVFTCEYMRNKQMEEFIEEWKPSRLFFGKNKVLADGLGRTKKVEIEDDIHKLSAVIKGSCALLFTDTNEKDVTAWFKNSEYKDFARAKDTASETIKLKAGQLPQFPYHMECHLRQLGLPTKLDRDGVVLTSDYTVCRKGKILTAAQAKIAEHLEIKLHYPKLNLIACYQKGKGFKMLKEQSDEQSDETNRPDEIDDEGIYDMIINDDMI